MKEFNFDMSIYDNTNINYGPVPEKFEKDGFTLKLEDDTVYISKKYGVEEELDNVLYFDYPDDAKTVYDHFKDAIVKGEHIDFYEMDESQALDLVGLGPEKEISILLIQPGAAPEKITVENTLEAKQQLVGGYIQAIYPYEDPIALIMNDEGKISGMELNRALYDDQGNIYDIVAGPMLVVGLNRDNFGSLSPELSDRYAGMFKYPEHFIRMDGQIYAIPYEVEKAPEKEPIKKDKHKSKGEER